MQPQADSRLAAGAALRPVPKNARPENEMRHARVAHYWSIIRRQAWKIGAFVAASLVVTFVVSSMLNRLPAAPVLNASSVAAQLEELKARMERSSEAAARVKNESNAGNSDEKSREIAQRLRQLNAEHANAQADLVTKKAAYDSVKSGLPEGSRAAGQGEGLQRIEERINEAEERSAEIKASKGQNDPEYTKEQLELQELRRQDQALRGDAASRAEADYNRSAAREHLVEKELAQAKAELERQSGHSVEYQQLQQVAEADRKRYEGLEASASHLQKPAFPNLPLNLGVAGLLSCFLAIGAAVLLDSLDTSIRDPGEVRRLFGTELIGALPVVKDMRSLTAAPFVPGPRMSPDGAGPGSQSGRSMPAFEEAIRMLRNSILLSDVDRSLQSILITSALCGEGRSTIAMHLAMAHAEQGKKTLLIDADLRQPTLDRKLGISDAGLGLAGALLGETEWQEVVIQISDLANLYLLPAGSPSSRASDLMEGRIAEMLDEAVRVYDLIILDAPPILGYAEPMHLAIAVDAVVVVASARGTDHRAIKAVVATLKRLRASLTGIVLNRVSPDAGRGDRYY
jgi:polysaccharide biosynthesis transport protein